MEMPGGGVFKLKPGQVTDDSELAFHLLSGLTRLDLSRNFEEQKDNIIITIAN
jgi:ADP-ribosylglycohydrolase